MFNYSLFSTVFCILCFIFDIFIFKDVGNLYLDHLFELKQYNEAAALCPTFLNKNKDVWETVVYRFAEIGQLRAIASCVPTTESLAPAIYEMILNEFLQNDQKVRKILFNFII